MNSLIKNNQSLSKYKTWTDYLEDAAKILIDENRIMDAAKYLQECWKWAVKRSDGVCLTCGGYFEFMICLMDNCKYNQIKQVRYLLMEFSPNMHPKWFFKEALMKRYYQMLQRG